jgi:predicted transcriptional regulator
MSLRAAVEELLADHQQDFPVVERGQVIGVLHRVDLLSCVAQGRFEATVRDMMARDGQFIEETMPLDQAFAIMQQSGHSMLPVLHGHSLVGVLTSDNIEEWLLVRSALHQHSGDAAEIPPRYSESLPA